MPGANRQRLQDVVGHCLSSENAIQKGPVDSGKALGKTVEFDIYPRGGHVLHEPALQRESMRRNLEWFSRWLRESTPPQ